MLRTILLHDIVLATILPSCCEVFHSVWVTHLFAFRYNCCRAVYRRQRRGNRRRNIGLGFVLLENGLSQRDNIWPKWCVLGPLMNEWGIEPFMKLK